MIKNLGQVAAIYVGKTAPRNVNMIWLDNTVIPYVFKSYNGEEWTEIPTGAWVETYVNGWLVSLQQGTVTTDDDYLLINSGGVNYKMTVKDFIKSSVGNPLDFKGVIRTDSDFPNPSTLEGGDMYIIITEPAGGTVTDPYSGKTFSDSEKIVWDSVINSWASLGKIDVKVDLSTTYSATEVTIHSSAGKETTVVGVTDDNAGVMVPVQKKWLDTLSDGSTLTPQGPSTAPYHKHRYSDIVDRIISQQVTGDSAINPMSQKATTEALDLKLDKSSVLQVSGVSTTDVMSQKAVTDAIQTLKSSIDDKLSRYLPLSGGTMTGTIKLATNNVHIEGLGQDGTTTYHILSLDAANRPTFGSPNVGVIIQTKTENILHKKASGTFIVHDTANLPDPARLGSDQTFTGDNTFTVDKFNVAGDKSKFSVNNIGGLRMYYDYADEDVGISRYLDFYTKTSSDTDYTRRGIFGLYASKSSANSDYVYIGAGDVGYKDAQYRFYPNILYVPEKFYLRTLRSKIQLIGIDNRAGFGGPLIPTWILSNNTDLFHSKYTDSNTHAEYKIWDESNLPNPASSTDLANYLPLSGGGMSGAIVLDNTVGLRGKLTNGNGSNLISLSTTNTLNIGSVNHSGVSISTGNYNIQHIRNNTSYKIYDSYNLPNPVQTGDLADYVIKSDLDAYATKAELEDYATKQWVTDNFSGGGSGADLLPADNTWSGTNTYTKNIVLNNNVSLASKKTDGSLMNIASINTSDVLALGNIGLDVKISSSYSDLIHKKSSGEYKIWDASNLANPVQTSDLDSYLTKTEASTTYYPIGGRGFLSFDASGRPIMNNNQGYSVRDKDSTAREVLWMDAVNNLSLGNTSSWTLPSITFRAVNVYWGNSLLATQSWVTNKNYLTSSSLDGYAKTTDLASYLPLAGGTMTGAINFSSSQILTLENKPLVAYDSTSNYVNIGSYSLNSRLFFLTSQTDLQHYRKNGEKLAGTSYKIWDAYNVSSPLDYMEGTAGQVASVSGKEISINGVNQTHIVLGLDGNGITLFAPTTAGTSGQVLQSQGAGKAPIWVDFSGGGVQLGDDNTWTGLNTFQGGLKTSDGTNSYDVWANDILKYPVKYEINSIGNYNFNYYTKTAGWRRIDQVAINNILPDTITSLANGGYGTLGLGTNAYESAAIAAILTSSIYFEGLNARVLSTNSDGDLEYGSTTNYGDFNSRNIRIAYPLSSGGGGSGGGDSSTTYEGGLTIGYYPINTKGTVTERAKIYCTTSNLYLKDIAKNTQLDFDTDGLYVTTGSTSKVRLATLNDVSGGGGRGVSLSDNNVWTGTNTFKSTVQALAQQTAGVGGTLSCGYDIRVENEGNVAEFKLEGNLYVDSRRFDPDSPYATLTVGSGLFTFNEGGSLTTKIGSTNYEFWNKYNLAKPVSYGTNTDGDAILYRGDITSKIINLEMHGIAPPLNDAVSLTNGGNGGLGTDDNAYAVAFIGSVFANIVTTTTIVVPNSENYFEFKEDGLYFYDIVNQEKYKINMTKV